MVVPQNINWSELFNTNKEKINPEENKEIDDKDISAPKMASKTNQILPAPLRIIDTDEDTNSEQEKRQDLIVVNTTIQKPEKATINNKVYF